MIADTKRIQPHAAALYRIGNYFPLGNDHIAISQVWKRTRKTFDEGRFLPVPWQTPLAPIQILP